MPSPRARGSITRCHDCGLIHDTKGPDAGACAGWLASIQLGDHGLAATAFDRLIAAANRWQEK